MKRKLILTAGAFLLLVAFNHLNNVFLGIGIALIGGLVFGYGLHKVK